jgi:LmbE family N-acetylglucosaminyl deacetylase
MFTSDNRILLLVAHPDDETIGFGGHLSQCHNLYLVNLTEGSPLNLKYANYCGCTTQEEYRTLRMSELRSALMMSDFDFSHYVNLHYVDLGVLYAIEQVINDVLCIIKEIQPEVILTHPYEGGHPDHDCAAYIVQESIKLISEHNPSISIKRMEFACYHGKNGYMETGTFLDSSEKIITVQLSGECKQIKEKMLNCFNSQKEMLSLFYTDRELFRTAPVYSFITPPHEGTLLYERMDMGIESKCWRNIVNSISGSFSQ